MILVNELANPQSSLSLSLLVGWVIGSDLVIKASLVSSNTCVYRLHCKDGFEVNLLLSC